MTTRGLSHLNLHAQRELLDALKDFYCGVVGLEVGARPPFPRFGYWLYAGSQPVVHLYEAAPDEIRRTDVATTFDHIAFDCANPAHFEKILTDRRLAYRRVTVPASTQVQLFVHDPAGNSVELNFSGSGA